MITAIQTQKTGFNWRTILGLFSPRKHIRIKTSFRCEVSTIKLGQTLGHAYISCKIFNHRETPVLVEKIALRIFNKGISQPELLESNLYTRNNFPFLIAAKDSASIEYSAYHFSEKVLDSIHGDSRVSFSIMLADKTVFESNIFSKDEVKEYVYLVKQQFNNF